MKRIIAVFALILALSTTVKSQPITLISFGPTVTILNTTSAGAVTGSTFALPGGNANVFTWTVVPVGAPSAISIALQVSNDNSAWFALSTCTTAAGCIFNSGVNAYKFVRSVQTSRTGGTSTTATVNTARAYGIGSGSNPNVAGQVFASNGTSTAPSYSFTSEPTLGFWRNGAGVIQAQGTLLGSGNIIAAIGNKLAINGRFGISSPSDGTATLGNIAGTDFGLLQFGGITSGFPALKRNASELLTSKADDSGSTGHAASYFRATATTFAGLPADVSGVIRYCSDCTIASPCAGAGTGAIAKRLNGVWVCN